MTIRHGPANTRPSTRKNSLSDFWRYVSVVPDPPDLPPGHIGPCWEWQEKSRDRDGYGSFKRGDTSYKSHKIAYVIGHGPVPEGMVVRHACDNPPCCRPSHLSVGTHQDNSNDMTARGRQARGEKIGKAKLTWERVREMRALRTQTDEQGYHIHSFDALAERYGVEVTAVKRVIAGKTWREDITDATD